MLAVGLVTEYNPFHNGHRYHAQQARQVSGAEVVVAVMSGHFLQRGEPALVDKWTRAQMALRCGVDVVIELPFPFACNSAPTFADGAIQILDLFSPYLDSVCFGSESGELEQLKPLAKAMAGYESVAADSHHLRSGQTFPQARAAALADQGFDTDLLDQPNNILSLAYLRAIDQRNSALEALTIKRIGVGYHDLQPVDNIASATALRQRLYAGDAVQPYLPPAAHELLTQAVEKKMVVDPQRWFSMLQQSCLDQRRDRIDVYQMEPGLDQRIFQAALAANDYEQLVDEVKARHLTRTRVQRLLSYQLFALRSQEMANSLAQPIPYLQLLGATQNGERFLSQCRKELPVPLVTNQSRIQSLLNRHYGRDGETRQHAQWMVDLEDQVTRFYTLLLPGWGGQSRQWNYYRSPLREL
ncbi:MAG: nucleotidyltransferase family protein [Deltaproteobacteria bacterium]|nr:nucleotidyltransferase family protein [Deltaproteobacteria bacterium]